MCAFVVLQYCARRLARNWKNISEMTNMCQVRHKPVRSTICKTQNAKWTLIYFNYSIIRSVHWSGTSTNITAEMTVKHKQTS